MEKEKVSVKVVTLTKDKLKKCGQRELGKVQLQPMDMINDLISGRYKRNQARPKITWIKEEK